MGNFLLDLRPQAERELGPAADFLKFYPDMRVERLDYPEFGLVLTSADKPGLWSAYQSPDGALMGALCGRIALDQKQWDKAATVEGSGGLACKHICQSYAAEGIRGIENLNGNFVILLFDRPRRELHLVTDRWGLLPAFRLEGELAGRIFSSHPDVLADAAGEGQNWDQVSFAEFILTGRLTAPYTYYRHIKALPVGSTTTLTFGENGGSEARTRCYFQPGKAGVVSASVEEVAERFAAAFRDSVTKRTLPLLGRTAIALSGGLDSRTVLCAAPDRAGLVAFTCYDEENREFRIAREIARRAGVAFVPLKRHFDYYADHAAAGVRISAGMGCIASNHFLGFRDQLREMGGDNLLTGCYCDYIFKGLALNKQVNRWTTCESLGPFGFSFYAGHTPADTELAGAVRERLEASIPAPLRRYNTESVVREVEQRRIFPLAYEEDNAERVIPQRVMGWYPPVAENELMQVHLAMDTAMKLNRTLFGRMMRKICPSGILQVPDANTGVPVTASLLREVFSCHLDRLGRFARKVIPTHSTMGSWLNWNSYILQSRKIQELWSEPNPVAMDVFVSVLGKNRFHRNVGDYRGREVWVFLQLFTLKLWFDQRAKTRLPAPEPELGVCVQS
ncbi:MAG: hypothetical protein KA122_01960 [Verrucomicrobia bacterium]|nr:hypothetical protein [Verrucomicrobiota bacterium]